MVVASSFNKRVIFNLTTFSVVLAFGMLGLWSDPPLTGWFAALFLVVRIGAMGLVFALAQPSNRSALATTVVGVVAWWSAACGFDIVGVEGVGMVVSVAFATTFVVNLVSRFDARHEWAAPRWVAAGLVMLTIGTVVTVFEIDHRNEQEQRPLYHGPSVEDPGMYTF